MHRPGRVSGGLQFLPVTRIDTTLALIARRRGRGFHFYYFGGTGWLVGLTCLIVVVALATWWHVSKQRAERAIQE